MKTQNLKIGDKVSVNDRIETVVYLSGQKVGTSGGALYDHECFLSALKCKNKSHVLKQAWKIAKNAAKIFGGKASQYLSQSMKKAWATENSVLVLLWDGGSI